MIYNAFFEINNPEKIIAELLKENKLSVSTAESCTGGLISSRLTDIAGSSEFIKENYVTYANEAKIKILDVKPDTIKQFGAVSEQCAREMAEGLFKKTGCDFVLCTTGLAGPSGGSVEKPVGTIFIATKSINQIEVHKVVIENKFRRKKMKYIFSQKALETLLEFIKKQIN